MSKGEIIKKAGFILAALALVALVVWLIVRGGGEEPPSTEGREYDEEEVRAAATELISKSTVINSIFYGEGIATEAEEDTSLPTGYKRADSAALAELGISSVEQLKDLARTVFSEGECENIIFQLFLAGSSGGNSPNYAHYINEYTEEDEEGNREVLGILVYKRRAESKLVREDERCEFRTDTLRVVGSEGERVLVTFDTVIYKGEESKTVKNEVYLIEQSGKWRLDSQTVYPMQ